MTTETDIARDIATGAAPSPTQVGGFWLVAMRVTGTGIAYRTGLKEYVWRDAHIYLNQDFMDRCAGVPVTWEHPQTDVLTSKEFIKRHVGSIMHPYIADDDGVENPSGQSVWAIARINDEDAIKLMLKHRLSTSPGVVLANADNTKLTTDTGKVILIEGEPTIIDHLACCELGVWDKDGPPLGIRIDSPTTTTEDTAMPEGNLDKILEHLTGLHDKMDAHGKRLDAFEKDRMDAEMSEWDDADREMCSSLMEHGTPWEKVRDAVRKARSDRAKRKDGEPAEAMEPGKNGEPEGPAADSRNDSMKVYWDKVEAQKRYNDVYQAVHGSKADAALDSEGTLAYRKRLLKPLLVHSAAFRDVEIARMDQVAFRGVEEVVIAEAMAFSKSPKRWEGAPQQKIVRVDDETGSRFTEFFGGESIFKKFAPPKRYAQAFKTPQWHAQNGNQGRGSR